MTGPPLPTWDPLGYNTPLPFSGEFFPLGFALQIQTNSQEVLAAAATSFATTDLASPHGNIPEQRLHLRFVMAPAQNSLPPAAPVYRAQGKFLSVAAGPNHFANCDLETSTAACWITTTVAANQRFFRYHYLEGIVYSLLCYRFVTPVHASCAAVGEAGALLSGPPGTGKSCLAYACARAGLTFVSDDVGYLLRGDADGRLAGRPRFLRLRPSALSLFPELEAEPVGADIDGEPIIEIQVDQRAGIATAPGCAAKAVVFLERRPSGPAAISPVDPQLALQLLVKELPVIGEPANRRQVQSLESLVRRGAYRLTYADLGSAAIEIRKLLAPHA